MGVFPRKGDSMEFNEEVLASHYQHVDNGGLTIQVVSRTYPNGEYGGIVLRVVDGYYDYSSHTLEFYHPDPKHLRKFSEVLLEAAQKLESIRANL